MLVQRVLILLWKYLLVKEEELFYWWKVSKFLLAPLFANARRVDVSKFRVKNTAILRLRPRKLIFLLFSKIKGFFFQITYLPKSYLWTKNEGNRFFNSWHSMVDISWPSLLIWVFRKKKKNIKIGNSERNQQLKTELSICHLVLLNSSLFLKKNY